MVYGRTIRLAINYRLNQYGSHNCTIDSRPVMEPPFRKVSGI